MAIDMVNTRGMFDRRSDLYKCFVNSLRRYDPALTARIQAPGHICWLGVSSPGIHAHLLRWRLHSATTCTQSPLLSMHKHNENHMLQIQNGIGSLSRVVFVTSRTDECFLSSSTYARGGIMLATWCKTARDSYREHCQNVAQYPSLLDPPAVKACAGPHVQDDSKRGATGRNPTSPRCDQRQAATRLMQVAALFGVTVPLTGAGQCLGHGPEASPELLTHGGAGSSESAPVHVLDVASASSCTYGRDSYGNAAAAASAAAGAEGCAAAGSGIAPTAPTKCCHDKHNGTLDLASSQYRVLCDIARVAYAKGLRAWRLPAVSTIAEHLPLVMHALCGFLLHSTSRGMPFTAKDIHTVLMSIGNGSASEGLQHADATQALEADISQPRALQLRAALMTVHASALQHLVNVAVHVLCVCVASPESWDTQCRRVLQLNDSLAASEYTAELLAEHFVAMLFGWLSENALASGRSAQDLGALFLQQLQGPKV